MNQLFAGSICVTDLIANAKNGHSAFSKAQNGKIYCNVLTWLNDEPDTYGNSMSHQLSSSKEMRDKETKIYIGNSKKFDSSQPVKSSDIDDDFSNVKTQVKSIDNQNAGVDDLPF